MRTLLTIAALLIASPAIAQELPANYGPGFSVDDEGYVAGLYDMSIWVISESAFSTGAEVCTGVGSSINGGVAMPCSGSVTFVSQVPSNISCETEVPIGDTFIALCQ
jgi:hypothetical protein